MFSFQFGDILRLFGGKRSPFILYALVKLVESIPQQRKKNSQKGAHKRKNGVVIVCVRKPYQEDGKNKPQNGGKK